MDTVGTLSRTKDDGKYYDHLLGNYSTVRRFLPALLRSVQFEAATAGQPVLKALDFLRKIEGKAKPSMDKAPVEILNAAWKKAGDAAGTHHRPAVLYLLRAGAPARRIEPA
jgi:hypothetical protein